MSDGNGRFEIMNEPAGEFDNDEGYCAQAEVRVDSEEDTEELTVLANVEVTLFPVDIHEEEIKECFALSSAELLQVQIALATYTNDKIFIKFGNTVHRASRVKSISFYPENTIL